MDAPELLLGLVKSNPNSKLHPQSPVPHSKVTDSACLITTHQ